MWLSEEYNEFFQQGVLVSEKIDEKDGVEIFKSKKLGNILSENGNLIFCEKSANSLFEMLTHVPLCSHPEANKVLVLGGADGGVACEILRHENVHVDVVSSNENIKELSAKHFTQLHKAFEDKRVTYTNSETLSFLEKAKENDFDIVIIQDHICLDDILLAQLNRVIKNDALLTIVSKNHWIDSEALSNTLEKLSQKFNIVMPYRYESYTDAGFGGSIVFASNKYHPTANMILQKADLIDDLKYYSCDIHVASFALPAQMRKELYKVMKV